jgi:hypothetical protein
MSKIKCEQKNCKYNNHDHCLKSSIYVAKNALCESYKEGKSKENLDFEISSLETLENNITCEATNCVHNKNQNCSINNLNIGKSKTNAPCIDFEKRI